MQFQETGPDQVLDIEQSETTKWLQHTGWPQLFRNRPLDIIAASSLQPGPAWNEDYLLGSWQGTQIWSSVAVEAQLRIILRGVDLMFDRAKFTLARTSYRSRCWLNTYWKDVFWPHEFRIVSSQNRYISTWKRFICFIFRALQSSPQLRREIYNLRLRPDEVKMMRHILDLASTLQQQGKEEWDDDSEYASQDEGEESSDGEDNESLEDYDGESSEPDEDEDVEYNRRDRDERTAFTLPPGFWLHLSEAIFQLSMMFWTYRDPAGDMSSSVLIHYTAVMGIQRDSLVYNSAYNSTPKLAALMWVGRLLFLEYALPVYTYDTLAFPWPCRTSYPSQPDRLDSIRRKYLLRGCYTPFGEMIELKAFAKSIVKREGIPGNLSWAPDGRSFTIGDDKKVQLSEFCETYHKVMAQVHEQVNEMMMGWDPSIDLSTSRDDLTCRAPGWSFLRKAENNLGNIWKTLLQRLESSSFRGRPFIKSGSWQPETCTAYLNAGLKLNKTAFAASHVTASLPGRGSEITSIRYVNTKLAIRNVFFHGGQMIIIIIYNKARASNNYAFYIVRYLQPSLSLSFLKYLAIIRPVWEFLAKQLHMPRHGSSEFFFLDPSGKKKHLSPTQASSVLKDLTRDLATPWSLSLYRQAALAIAKPYLRKLVEKTNFYYPSDATDPIRMFAAGAGHHPRMLLTTYAILQPELLDMYQRLATIWQE